MAFTDLRMEVDPMPVCSDASHTGGAVCGAVCLTSFGSAAAAAEERAESAVAAEQVLLIAYFAGPGGLRRSWDLLGVPCAGEVAIENGPAK